MKTDADSARVRIPPPLILLSCMLAGVGIHQFFPVHFMGRPERYVLGMALIVSGVMTILRCASRFKKAEIDIKPWKPTSHLMTGDLYRFTRNPIYLSFVLIQGGLACVLDSAATLGMVVPLVLALDFYVIRNEEAYLSRKFGDEYRTYASRVRRWI